MDSDLDDLCDERLVLSEVHLGSCTQDKEAELVSRYTYLTPPSRGSVDHDTSSDSEAERSDSSSGSHDSNSSSAGDSSGGSTPVPRRRKRPRCRATSSQRRSRPTHEVLTIVHKMATTLGLVGQQVWSAAFLLGDFVLTHEELFAGMQVLELGSGPGVAGLVAGRVAQRCYLTDYHDEVLKLLARNVEANRHLFALERSLTVAVAPAAARRSRNSDSATEGDVQTDSDCGGKNKTTGGHYRVAAVRELDWFAFSTKEGPIDADIRGGKPAEDESQACQGERGEEAGLATAGGDCSGNASTAYTPRKQFAWSKEELEGLLPPAPRGGLVIIAADVIYDEGLTDAFFDVLRELMPAPPSSVVGTKTEEGIADDSRCDGSRCPRKGAGPGGSAEEVESPSSATSAESSRVSRAPHGSYGTQAAGEGRGEGGGAREVNGNAVLYLALEKRFNFSMAELSVAATGYNALLRNVVDTTNEGDSTPAEGTSANSSQGLKSQQKSFRGKRLPLSFQQCFRYQRSNAMELWEIRRRPAFEGREA